MGRRLIPAIILLVGLCVVLAVPRILVSRSAGLLLRWGLVGLPGKLSSEHPPSFPFAWPPRVLWQDLSLTTPRSGWLRCSRLEVAIRPLPLLRGKVVASSLHLDGVRVQADSRFEHLLGALLASAGSDASALAAAPPHPNAVRLEVTRLLAGGGYDEGCRLEGWGWLTQRSVWSMQGVVRRPRQSGPALTIQGEGIGSVGEGSVELNRGDSFSVRIAWKDALAQAAEWNLSGRDDGTLASAVLDALGMAAESTLEGRVDFDMTLRSNGIREGEIRLDPIALLSSQGEAWRASGLVCISEDSTKLQDVVLANDGLRVVLVASIARADSASHAGTFHLAGVRRAERLEASGDLTCESQRLLLHCPSVRVGALASGPVEAEWCFSPPEVSGQPTYTVDIVGRFGGGSIRLRGSPFRSGSRTTAEAKSVSLEAIAPFLPASLPGVWSGRLDAAGAFSRLEGGLRGTGEALIADGQVSGLPFLEEIASFRGDRAWGRARFERASFKWLYREGGFLADSLLVAGRGVAVSGTVCRAAGDSLLGLLRLAPAGGRGLPSIFRLLGGSEDRLDLGLSGSLRSPEVGPIGDQTRRELEARLAQHRRFLEGETRSAQRTPSIDR